MVVVVVVVIMIMVVAKIEGIFEVTIITTTLSTFRGVKRYKKCYQISREMSACVCACKLLFSNKDKHKKIEKQ